MTADAPERYCDVDPAHVKETIRENDDGGGVFEGAIFRDYPACDVETVAGVLDNMRRTGEVYVVDGRYRIT